MLRYGQSLTFFDADAIGTSIFYDDLGEVVTRDGLPGVVDQIDVILKEQQPSFVVIDSFKALRSFASDEAEFRRFLHDLAGRLTAVAASSFWIGEYDRNQAADAPEFAVADAIIALHANRTAERELARAASAQAARQRLSHRRARVPHRRRRPRRLSSPRRRIRHDELHAQLPTRLDRHIRHSTNRSVTATGRAR